MYEQQWYEDEDVEDEEIEPMCSMLYQLSGKCNSNLKVTEFYNYNYNSNYNANGDEDLIRTVRSAGYSLDADAA